MCHFWEAGAETEENITFGELAARLQDRWRTTTGSGANQLSMGFIDTFEEIKLPLWFYSSWTDNLYNNNI